MNKTFHNTDTFFEVILMRQKLSICIFFGIIFVVTIAGLFAMEMSLREEEQIGRMHTQVEETQMTEQDAVESGMDIQPYQFYLMAIDGQISVFESDKTTWYMDTGIMIEDVPDMIRIQLEEGMGFVSEEELFSFLENYSS